jgi:hypothetical protein
MSRALLSEIDLGILSRDEESMLPIPRNDYEQRETDWLYFALYLARGARIRASRLAANSLDFYAERYAQDMALESAKLHAANLTRRGYPLTADIIAFMRREGI